MWMIFSTTLMLIGLIIIGVRYLDKEKNMQIKETFENNNTVYCPPAKVNKQAGWVVDGEFFSKDEYTIPISWCYKSNLMD